MWTSQLFDVLVTQRKLSMATASIASPKGIGARSGRCARSTPPQPAAGRAVASKARSVIRPETEGHDGDRGRHPGEKGLTPWFLSSPIDRSNMLTVLHCRDMQ